MRKAQKQQAENLVRQMEGAHDQMKKYLEQKNVKSAMKLLEDCQNSAISLGTLIENVEGEGHPTVSLLEQYCELAYQIHEELFISADLNANKPYKQLKQKLVKISNSIKNDIRIRLVAVFLPYKVSMWDSLESVWRVADEDPDCDAYVIPIPYYDKNPDGSFREMHYEADQYPVDVPVTKYDEFDFGEHRPDMIFIHSPYDAANFVTSVHPFFYSDNLKKFTDCLVYIPYYATAGGMSEGQALCPAYINADYIVIQSEKYRKFFDERIPDHKFLAFGSPKFDSVIHKCQNPPEAPKEWKLSNAQLEKIRGKKVYFFNTSIGGMLGYTEAFLKKIQYVFDLFKGREDACLLWRPHPLLESTFDSMRREYKPQYLALKKQFVEEGIGILDETPDVETAIALSDAYIGDSATSVTSLFGVVGKPLFILNNYINTLPEKDDWWGGWINPQFDPWKRENDRFYISQNNQLWISEKNDYHYKFYMDLGMEYFGGGYYITAVEAYDKIYVIPRNAQNILVIKDKKIKKIELPKKITQPGVFRGYYYNQKYLFLYPDRYPFLVRFNMETEELTYVSGIQQFSVRNIAGEWRYGAVSTYGNELVFASPEENQFVFMDMDTLQTKMLSCDIKNSQGTYVIVPDGDELWLMPVRGIAIACWNPKTGDVMQYDDVPEDFRSIKWPYCHECDELPFAGIEILKEENGETILIAPCWGNMFLFLDRQSGKMKKWEFPGQLNYGKNGYFETGSIGVFVTFPDSGKAYCRAWHVSERKLYNIDAKECREIEIRFDYDEVKEHEPGFAEESEWMQYCLNESAFNSLKDFLDDTITGNRFNRERQIRAFSKINANTDGTCGKTIYQFIKDKSL